MSPLRSAFERFFGGAGGVDGVAFVLQNRRERFANSSFVIDNQQLGPRGHLYLSSSRVFSIGLVAELATPNRLLAQAAGFSGGFDAVAFGDGGWSSVSADGSSTKKREPTGKLSST